MSLGLPSHLARQSLSRAIQKAFHAIAFTALLCAGLVVVAFMAARPELVLWPALLAVLFMGVALWLNDHFDGIRFDFSYLAVGAAGLYWYAITFYTQLPDVVETDGIWLALPKIAIVMVAGAGVSSWAAIGWCVSGMATAELVALVVAAQVGVRAELDAYTLSTVVIAIISIALSTLARFRVRKSQPQLHRAAREERIAALRSGMELKAAALLHDTVLSHLAAIANTAKTELDPDLTVQIRRDLEILVGEEWLRDVEYQAPAGSDWRKSPLYLAVQDAKRQGLVVDGTGDIAAVDRLDRARSSALGLAARQCLANVIKHSGTMKAEVAVYGSDAEVSVMIVDEGKGFELAAVGPDRLGLRASVRRRIEAVGGTVQVWSTPGNGTSVLIRVPVSSAPGNGPAPSERTAADPLAETLIEAQPAEEHG
ncbi:MAG TPA: ATP-binding protein [Homoserinimonas sp.]|nr:ATP-binding protein [Homoserinimonas sp.]